MKQLIVALLAAIATLLRADRTDKDTIAAQKRKIQDLTDRLDGVDPDLEAQVNDTLNQVAAATAGEDGHVAEVSEIEPTEVTLEQREANIARDAQTRGIAPPNPAQYAKSIQRAQPVEEKPLVDENQTEAVTGEELAQDKEPLKDANGNPLPVLPPPVVENK